MILTFSINLSILVTFRQSKRMSWTIPITGLLDWGETMHFGTIFSSETSSQHLKWLGYMHIHFISIKISIIRWRDWQVQSKCWVWHDFNLVPHDRHLMYTRLLIEKNKVSIIQMSHHLWNTCWISVFLKNVRTKWNNH